MTENNLDKSRKKIQQIVDAYFTKDGDVAYRIHLYANEFLVLLEKASFDGKKFICNREKYHHLYGDVMAFSESYSMVNYSTDEDRNALQEVIDELTNVKYALSGG